MAVASVGLQQEEVELIYPYLSFFSGALSVSLAFS